MKSYTRLLTNLNFFIKNFGSSCNQRYIYSPFYFIAHEFWLIFIKIQRADSHKAFLIHLLWFFLYKVFRIFILIVAFVNLLKFTNYGHYFRYWLKLSDSRVRIKIFQIRILIFVERSIINYHIVWKKQLHQNLKFRIIAWPFMWLWIK